MRKVALPNPELQLVLQGLSACVVVPTPQNASQTSQTHAGHDED